MFIYTVCVILACALAFSIHINRKLGIKERRQYENSCTWNTLLNQSIEDYKALEAGRDEETESYEQMFLSFQDSVMNLAAANEVLRQDRDLLFVAYINHEQNCLPVFGESDLPLEELNNIKLRMTGVTKG